MTKMPLLIIIPFLPKNRIDGVEASITNNNMSLRIPEVEIIPNPNIERNIIINYPIIPDIETNSINPKNSFLD